MPDIGDFSVPSSGLEFAREQQDERSGRARGVDNENRAPVTTNATEWAENPNELDYPGIDTPSENPRVLPKDQKRQSDARNTTTLNDRAAGRPASDAIESGRPAVEDQALTSRDVPLSPDEAFGGVATSGRAELGNTDLPVEDRFGRFDATPEEEQDEIAEIAAENDPFEL